MNAAGQAFDPHPDLGGRLGTPGDPMPRARRGGIDVTRTRAPHGAIRPAAGLGPRPGTMTAARGLVPPRSARGGAVHLPARRARGYRIPRALPAILAAAAALVPATAAAAPAPLPGGSLPARAEQFIETTLQVPITRRPFVPRDTLPCPVGADGRPLPCVALSYPNRVELVRWLFLQVRAVERDRIDVGVVIVVLHEALHRTAPAAEVDAALAAGAAPITRGVEEGRVQALAADLQPAFCRAVRITCAAPDRIAYRAEVNAVRSWSARVTASSWRSRAARLARRQLWAATPADAQRMYDDGWLHREHERRP